MNTASIPENRPIGQISLINNGALQGTMNYKHDGQLLARIQYFQVLNSLQPVYSYKMTSLSMLCLWNLHFPRLLFVPQFPIIKLSLLRRRSYEQKNCLSTKDFGRSHSGARRQCKLLSPPQGSIPHNLRQIYKSKLMVFLVHLLILPGTDRIRFHKHSHGFTLIKHLFQCFLPRFPRHQIPLI
jgi:hypothetical protein